MQALEAGEFQSLQPTFTQLPRFWQLQNQLKVINGVLYRNCRPHPAWDYRQAIVVHCISYPAIYMVAITAFRALSVDRGKIAAPWIEPGSVPWLLAFWAV